MPCLRVSDTTSSGSCLGSRVLRDLPVQATVRELIRSRVRQEAEEQNHGGNTGFRGLVQPTPVEATLNGKPPAPGRRRVVDWEEQYRRAIEAFERNGFFVLIGERQAASLDETFTVTPDTEVHFVKLTPLVGG